MAYRNKTFVSFDSEDIHAYRLMQAWKANDNIDFDFHDAHDLNTARDTSEPETIERRLSERLSSFRPRFAPTAWSRGGRTYLETHGGRFQRLAP
jgi:hypothetical protein